MNITELTINGIYKLNATSPIGAKHVQVIANRGGKIEAATGRLSDGEFSFKTITLNDKPVRRVILTAEDFAEFIQEGVEMVNETHVVLDGDEPIIGTDNEGNEVEVKKPMTAAEKIQAIKDAEKAKIEAVKTKERLREEALIAKRVTKLTDAAEKAGVKEAEVAAQYGEDAKRFKDLTEEQAKAAIDGLKVKAKEKKKADDAINKVIPKLRENVEKAGLKEADVAAEFSDGRVKKFDALTPDEAKAAVDALKERAKDKAKADALALKTTLTDEEAVELRNLEKVVEKNLDNFQKAAFQIGGALQGISQKKLYRQTHATFEAYVSERFGLSRPHAYSVMTAAQTFAALTENEAVDAKSLPSITAAEAIARGVKGLLKDAGLHEDPEAAAITRQMARNVFELAVQNAPKDKDGKAILSPAHLSSTFDILGEVARTGLVEIDGKQIPMNLAAASIDEMITEESHERVEQMRANLANRIAASEATAREAKPSRVDQAISSATGNGQVIPEGVQPKLTVICSVHGRNVLETSSDLDVELGCGCVFINTPEGYLFEKNKKA